MTTSTAAPRKLAALLASFERRRPKRAGSLIVTLYGDAIVPRGGSLWLGSLLELMAGFGVESGLVRTAVSRLVADGWFERTRLGKQSYYRLSAWGAAEFAAATTRIYRAGEPPWSGEMEIAVITAPDPGRRAEHRERLLRNGWGQAAISVMVRPHWMLDRDAHPATSPAASPSALQGVVRGGGNLHDYRPPGLSPSRSLHRSGGGDAVASASSAANDHAIIGMTTRPQSAENARALAQACWQLDALEAAYRGFLNDFAPVADEIVGGARLADAQAFQLRTLLIHDWRRIVLRDPLLPRAMLPEDWPGTRALDLTSSVYRQVLAGAERWLDRHTANEDGPLPPPAGTLAERFRAL